MRDVASTGEHSAHSAHIPGYKKHPCPDVDISPVRNCVIAHHPHHENCNIFAKISSKHPELVDNFRWARTMSYPGFRISYVYILACSFNNWLRS